MTYYPLISKKSRWPTLQSKLKIGEPGDRYEREADTVSDRVMRMRDGESLRMHPLEEEEGAMQMQPLEEEEVMMQAKLQMQPEIWRQCPVCRQAEGMWLQPEKSSGQMSPVIQRLDDGGLYADASLSNRLHSRSGLGSPLPEPLGSEMESKIGADLSRVRVHTDSKAAEMNRDIGAQAFTYGSDVYFNKGYYNPSSTSGKHLLAHELTHVVQQGETTERVQLTPETDWESANPEGRVDHVSNREIILWNFRVGSAALKSEHQEVLRNFAMQQWPVLRLQAGSTLEINGHTSGSGSEQRNDQLSYQRALQVEEYIIRHSVEQGRCWTSGRGESQPRVLNNTPANMARNRRVEIRVQAPSRSVTPTRRACPPQTGAGARTLNEYIDLIRCAETTTGFNSTQMLAMLRQMYYGKPWSATSTTSLWDNVIPCSLSLGHPRIRLGNNLFSSLHASAVVQSVDVGHIFTGLEAMRCPRQQVVMSRLLPAGTVSMSNEEVATWGGDLGAAAAAMVACYDMTPSERLGSEDCGHRDPPQGLPFYLTQVHVPLEDLEGDIAAYVMRAAALNIPCTGSRQQRFILSGHISDMFANYFTNTGPAGRTQTNRHRCFIEAVGGSISDNRINNKDQLVIRFSPAVTSFSGAFYIKIMEDARGPDFRIVPHGNYRIRLRQHSVRAVRLFFDWLEGRL